MRVVSCENLPDYKGLGKALKLADGKFEIIVTLDVGPRVISFSLAGKGNMFEDRATLEERLPDGTQWQLFGGHRVWHSPEAFPRSYLTDSVPIDRYELKNDGIIMYQKEEEWTKIVKAIEVRFTDKCLLVINHLINNGAWPVEVAVWSLTVGAKDGLEVCPVIQRNTGLLPNTAYVSWPYSRMDDPRVRWGQRYIAVSNDPMSDTAFKFGYANEYGWGAFFNREQCFIKKFCHERGAKYPDMNASWQTYSGGNGTEMECLSPLQLLQSGKALSLSEEWYLFDCPERPRIDEDEIDACLKRFAADAAIELPVVSSEGWDPTFDEKE